MQLLKAHKLNKRRMEEAEKLVETCLKADGLERRLYLQNDLNCFKELNCFFLLYDKHSLVSVLTLLVPSESEAEISAYTLPQERKKGYFKTLFTEAKKELQKFAVQDIVFITEPASSSGLEAVRSCPAVYWKSEYLLQKPHSDLNCSGLKSSPEISKALELRKIKEQEIYRVSEMKVRIFGGDLEEGILEWKEIVESDDMEGYCFYKDGELTGISGVSHGRNASCIFDFGIAPEYQGKGYGKQFLYRLLERIYETAPGDIILQVSSENPGACSLYKSAGFGIRTQYDYYRYRLK